MAVIERDGCYLISQRLPGDSFGGLWEFPGGAALAGESLEACLAREIQEELGVRVSVGEKLQVIEHSYPTRTIRLHCFLCHILEGEPQAIECSAWRWVSAPELTQYQFPPASGPLIEALQRARRG